MIKITLCKQSKGYCGPAALKMVLSVYGIKRSEKFLAKLTKTSRIKGCYEKNIVKAAQSFGLKGYVKEKSNLKELERLVKKGIPVIVDWFSPEEAGHYSVVVSFTKDHILLADPHFGKIKKHKKDWFKERWFDVLKDKLILRGIIVIHK